MRAKASLLLLPLLALVSCDSGGGSGGGTIVTPPPTGGPAPSPAPAPTPTPVPFPTPTPTGGDFFAQAAAMFTVQPDIAACQPGQLTSQVTTRTLQSLNAIRALHRLPAVSYSSADEAGAQQAALMMAANAQLSHTPPTNWRCYTAAGAAAAGASNLYGGLGSGLTLLTDEQILAGWLTEIDNLTAESVGHRRWLLDPFLGSVAYGRVAGPHATYTRTDAAAMKVFDTAGPAGPTGPLPPYVAYPFEDYPARLFDTNALLSFGVISNPTNRWGNTNVSFANATVTVRQRGGGTLAVSRQRWDNDGYGLPNNLQFFVSGLQPNVIYDVSINGVSVGAAATNYSYWFRIVP